MFKSCFQEEAEGGPRGLIIDKQSQPQLDGTVPASACMPRTPGRRVTIVDGDIGKEVQISL